MPATVLISGLGIAGPTLAFWLDRYGFAPTIVERAPAPRPGGYMIDFWGVGYDVAARMSLLPALRDDGYALEEIRLVDNEGQRVGGFGAGVFRSATGGRFLSIMRGDLASRIYALIEHDVPVMFGDGIVALEEDASGMSVRFEHAPPKRFDLVIGADGLHSAVRALQFAAGGTHEHFLGYYTAAFSADDYPHRDEGVYVSHTVPGRQIARYALRDGRSAFFFVFARDEPLASPPHDRSTVESILRAEYGGAGWECAEILAAMSRAHDLYFDAVSQTRLPDWSRGRTALVGDAAYAPSLLAGQGAALAMAGAYVLAHALAAANGDHRAAFRRYQTSFKPLTDAKQQSARSFGGWFAPRSRAGLWFRNAASRTLNVPLIARLAVSRSLGDQFELPADVAA
jgi:2-polyprenyl-6-methoxyphenol hydroxylase-like FAD-dependent oxidoreductase